MFLTERQAQERLSSEKNLANRFSSSTVHEVVIKSPGKNRVNLTTEERTEIAIRTRTGEKNVDLAKEKNLSQLTISNIKTGKVQGVDEDKVNDVVNEVRDKALERLMHSLGLLTNDKLSGCSAKDLSVIASNMGRVFEKTAQQKFEDKSHINLIIYSPELKQETSFPVIEI